MLDASPVLLCLLGSDGRILRMNAAGARLLAPQCRPLLGQSLADRLQGSGDQVTLATLDAATCAPSSTAPPAPPAGRPGCGGRRAVRNIGPELEMSACRRPA